MANCYRNLDEILTTSDGLAKIFSLTRPRIIQLANEEVLKRDKNSKYLVGENVRAFLKYTKKESINSPKDGEDDKVDYWKEKALHEKAKRQLTEISLAQKVGQIHAAKDVELVMTEMLVNLRTKLQGFPSQISTRLEGQTQDVIYSILNSEIEKTLAEMSDYNSDLFDTGIEGEDD